MSEPITITDRPEEHDGMNFAVLREEGLGTIQRLNGDVWTDHNIHDPGVTILEQICYVITDLCYRLDFDVEDLLAAPPQSNTSARDQFFTAGEILPVKALTILDYRKLIIDRPGVKNAWFVPLEEVEPVMSYHQEPRRLELNGDGEKIHWNGLFKVLIERDDDALQTAEEIEVDVTAVLRQNRNLCEDFYEIKVLDHETIAVKAHLDLEPGSDAEHILAEIYHHLDRFLSPLPRFHSLSECLNAGWNTDRIFTGPLLTNGFLDEEELARYNKRSELHASDLISVILNVKGVQVVRQLSLLNALDPDNPRQWALPLHKDKAPHLQDLSDFLSAPAMTLFKDGIQIAVDLDRVMALVAQLRGREQTPGVAEPPFPLGDHRELEDYEPMQNHLPPLYGIGQTGLPESVNAERKGLAKQLRAWMMLFDQLLATQFKQLSRAADLLSVKQPAQGRTYFSQVLTGTPGLGEIRGDDQEAHGAALDALVEPAGNEVSLDRKNRIHDHLLARFGEIFPDYALLGFERPDGDFTRMRQDYLSEYPNVSASRNQACDYQGQNWGTDKVVFLKKRLAALLGFTELRRNYLADIDFENFYIMEHSLLRPSADQEDTIPLQPTHPNNPISFRMSYVIPSWPGRFQDSGFRKLVEDVIDAETSAHITGRVLWYDQETMAKFQMIYYLWWELKRLSLADDDWAQIDKASAFLLTVLPIEDVDQVGLGNMEIEKNLFVFYDVIPPNWS